MTKSRGILPPRRRWEQWELDMLRRWYPDKRTDWIACAFRCDVDRVYKMATKLGLQKSETFRTSPDAHRLDGRKGMRTRFQKGLVPANKGLRGRPSTGRMAETQFKTGARPHTWLPVGTLNTDTEGYLKVKLREPGVWGYLHQLVWASTQGWPPPPNTVIRWRDGNRMNCDPSNLHLVSRRELMAANTIHNLPEPLRNVIRARASLVRRIRNAEGKDRRGPARADVHADGEAS